MIGQAGQRLSSSADHTLLTVIQTPVRYTARPHDSWAAGISQCSQNVPGTGSMAGSAGQCSGVMNDRIACSKTMQMHSCRARVRSALRVHDHCTGKSRRDHEDASTLAGRLAGRSSAPMSRASRVARGGGSKGSNPQFEVMGSECMNQAG